MGYAKNKFRLRLTDSYLGHILHILASDTKSNYQTMFFITK